MFKVVIFFSAILTSYYVAARRACWAEKIDAGKYDGCYEMEFGCNYCYLDFDETVSRLENNRLCEKPDEEFEPEEQICSVFNTWVDCMKADFAKKNYSEEVKAKKMCKATANYTARGWGENCGNPCQPPLTTLPITTLPTTTKANSEPTASSFETTLAPGTTEPVSQTATSVTTSGPISTEPVSQSSASDTTLSPSTTEPVTQNDTSDTTLGPGTTEPASHSATSETTSGPISTEPVSQNGTSETTIAPSTTEPVSQKTTSESTVGPITTEATPQTGTAETTLAPSSTAPVSQNATSETTSAPITTEPVSQNATFETTLSPGTTEPVTQNATSESTSAPITTEPVSQNATSHTTLGPGTTEPVSKNGTSETTLIPSTTEPVSQTVTSETASGPISTEPVSHEVTSASTSESAETVTTIKPLSTVPSVSPTPSQCPKNEHYEACAKGREITCDDIRPDANSTYMVHGDCAFTGCMCDAGLVRENNNECVSIEKCHKTVPSTTVPVSQKVTSDTTLAPGTTEPQKTTSETTPGPISTEPVSPEVTSESTSVSLATVPSQSPSPNQCPKNEHYESCSKNREIKCDIIRPDANISNAVQGDCAFTGCMCDAGLVRENNNECVSIEKCRKTVPSTTEPVSQKVTSETTSGPISTESVSPQVTSKTTSVSLSTVPSQSPTPTQCPKDEHYEACSKNREIKCDDIRPDANSTYLIHGDCAFTGCMCDAGLVRENNNECISIEKCRETGPTTTEPVSQKATSESTSSLGTTESVSQKVTSDTTLSPGTTEPVTQNGTLEFTLVPIPTLPVSQKVTSEQTTEPPFPKCPIDEHYEACYQWREIKCDDIRPKMNGTKLEAFRSLNNDCAFTGCMCDAGLVRENNNECISVEKCRGTGG